MKLTGAEIFVECLKEQGTDVIFGYPGGAVLNIYDALFKTNDITHILTSHEQGASHAADGYARATGKVGVCLATSGPGATNLVTGIATAYMDSIPMVAFTGQVNTHLLGRDSFQEVDTTGITTPITKHNYIVKDVERLADTIRNAFMIAKSGRPGPVLVDICKDVTASKAQYTKQELSKTIKIETDHVSIQKAAQIINQSSKPLILSGGGVISGEGCEELKMFAQKLEAPVSTTLMGLGSFPADHQLSTGIIGMHGSRTSNLAACECDLIIAVGVRFSDRVINNVEKFSPNAKIIHIDIDPAEIGKNIAVHHSIIGDVKDVLAELIKEIQTNDKSKWIQKITEWKSMYPVKRQSDQVLRPQFIMEEIESYTRGDAIITTEVGQNQLWAAQYYGYKKPRTLITSGGLGTMGYGLGACIGVQVGCPDKKVFNIAGDGSFRMNCNELATAVEYNLPVVIVILNNRVLGMVRQWQSFFYQKRFSHTDIDRKTDFVKLAEAYGAHGVKVSTKEQFSQALADAFTEPGPYVIDCAIDKDEMVFPMIPAGGSAEDIIDEI